MWRWPRLRELPWCERHPLPARRGRSKEVSVMMKLQPVPQQDRPKVIGVVIGIAVALTFVVRNLGGTRIQAQPGAPPAAAVPAASPAAASVNPPLASSEPAAAGTLPAPEAAEQSSIAAGFGEAEGLPLTDPFHPIHGESAPSPAPVVRPVAMPPAAPRRIASTPAVPGKSLPEPAARVPAVSLPQPAPPPVATAARPPAEPSLPTVLYGTVCQGRSGVAILRGDGKSVFARVGDTVSGWQITTIRLGQVGISREDIQRRGGGGGGNPGGGPSAGGAQGGGAARNK